MIHVELKNVVIRRDSQTITPVTVPSYELPVLRNLFGKENVVEHDSVGVIEVDEDGEYGRLCAKYGQELISKIFGEDDGLRLSEIVFDCAVEAPKKPAKPKKEAKQEDEVTE